MEEEWLADRHHLQQLLNTRPDWTRQDLADATGRSVGWVKKVQQNTSVKLDSQRYCVNRALVGQQVTLIIHAADRTLIIEHQGKEVRRLPLQGTGRAPCSFEQFVEQLCEEARTGRRGVAPPPRQLALNL